MSKSHLSNDDFFARLSELFEERKAEDHGSIFLIQKRSIEILPQSLPTPVSNSDSVSFGDASESLPPPTSFDSFPDLQISKPLPILIRATNGKSREHKAHKVKLSTIVEADGLEAFFTKYADVCKSGMVGLKKRDRSKGKKKMKAKKKKVVQPGGLEG